MKFFSLSLYPAHGFPPQVIFSRLGDYLPQVLYPWFLSLVFHWVRTFFSQIIRSSYVLYSTKFASKRDNNFNNIYCLNILLSSRHCLVNSHIMHIWSNNAHMEWWRIEKLIKRSFYIFKKPAIYCHWFCRSIIINLIGLLI